MALFGRKKADKWIHKGKKLFQLGQFDEALEAYKKALELNPHDVSALNNIGDTLSLLGRFGEALETYELAIELDPNDADRWNILGNVLVILDRSDEALEAYDQAIKIDPNNASTLNNKGKSLNSLKQYDKALDIIDQAIMIDPTNTDIWENKGQTLYFLQRDEEAKICFDQAIKLDPDNCIAQLLNTEISKNLSSGDSSESTTPNESKASHAINKSIIIERTIFDPVTAGFISSSTCNLPKVQQWIMSHDPTSYWYVICLKNTLDQPIGEWGISLEMGKTAGISDIFIENKDTHVAVDEYTDKEKPWVKSLNFGFSRHDSVAIPCDSSLKLYIKLYSKACNTDLIITGRFIAEGFESIDIPEKHFTFACDLQNYKTALTTNPEIAKKLTENALNRSFDPDTTRVLLHAFDHIRDISQCFSQRKYDLTLDKMQTLDDLYGKASAPERFHKMLSNNIHAVEMLEDGEETYERVERLWSLMLDTWQNEYIVR